jgi:hypothetical protein
VQFADWAGPLREGDSFKFTASDLIYDASEDFVRIAQDVTMRRCGDRSSAETPPTLRSGSSEK